MKRVFFVFVLMILFFQSKCYSEYYSSEINYEIQKQIECVNTKKLMNQLPDSSIDLLKKYNIDIFSVKNLNFVNFTDIIISITKTKLVFPIKFLLSIICILLVFCIFLYFCQNGKEILNFILICSICISVSYPIIDCVNKIVVCLKIASNFILCFVPIFMTFAISAGFPTSSAIFNSTILYCNQIIMEFSKNILLPISNSMIGLSIISSLSTKIKAKKIFDIFYSIIKFILIFVGTMISFVFSIQKMIGSSIDSAVSKELKMLSGLIPIVGSSLGDATITVRSSAKILEANVGAFGMVSVLLIFLPSILESYIWIISLQICEFLSHIFDFENLEIFFSSLRKTINISLSIIAIFIFIFIFVTSAIMNIKL